MLKQSTKERGPHDHKLEKIFESLDQNDQRWDEFIKNIATKDDIQLVLDRIHQVFDQIDAIESSFTANDYRILELIKYKSPAGTGSDLNCDICQKRKINQNC